MKTETIIFLLVVLGNAAIALWKKWNDAKAARAAQQSLARPTMTSGVRGSTAVPPTAPVATTAPTPADRALQRAKAEAKERRAARMKARREAKATPQDTARAKARTEAKAASDAKAQRQAQGRAQAEALARLESQAKAQALALAAASARRSAPIGTFGAAVEPSSAPRRPVISLRGRQGLRQAMRLREMLGPPRALRPWDATHS
jgi:hypothetical protein